jgi:CHAT domain-containing protein
VDRGLFDGLPRLPDSAREVAGITSLLLEDQVRSYLGLEATEDRAKQELATARYVHLAAHGVADPENPLDSFLALTIPEQWSLDKNNGLLETWEVIDHLHLDADLVVLSACVTALGPELGGEGLMNLARAFQIAGARTVAASLWPVTDESTAELMIRFYRHLIQDHMPKDEALRAAQMELIRGPIEVTLEDGTVVERDFSAPYHWAAFQLIGDWQ